MKLTAVIFAALLLGGCSAPQIIERQLDANVRLHPKFESATCRTIEVTSETPSWWKRSILSTHVVTTTVVCS